MNLHPNGMRVGTIKRAPVGFAHAMLIDQGNDSPQTWIVIDASGLVNFIEGLVTDEEVVGWPVVYEPLDDKVWELLWREQVKAGLAE